MVLVLQADICGSLAVSAKSSIFDKRAPNLLTLRARIVTEFSGKQVSVAHIEKFVLLETAFRESHYKGILKTLEKEGRLTLPNLAPGRRAGTFGVPAMIVRFG